MPIDFQFDDLEALKSQLNAILVERGDSLGRIPSIAVRQGAFELLALVKDRTPRGKTGALVKSIAVTIEKIGTDTIKGHVGSPLEYARYLEEGTGVYGPKGQPITIMAKNAGGLFWGAFDGKGDALIRKKVIIQGIKPRSMFAGALTEFLPRYQEIIQEELAKVASA